MTADQLPTVSVIVPARNEEACLGSCLESLLSQTGIDFEVIVVDDASTDRTVEIARSFTKSNAPAAVLVSAPVLAPGWTGKNNAMSAGAKVAKGKWLLFTDADTVHKPGSLARAVAEAEQNGASLLSYSPEQEVRTFWEKAVMPVIFAELAATYPPEEVCDPSSRTAAANGQYLLISHETYDAIGGHSKIAADLLEDVALARLVKSSGRKIFFRYGADAVRTRMYRNWAQMKEGWTKNLAFLFRRPALILGRTLLESFILFAATTALIQIGFSGLPAVPSRSVLLPHYPLPNRYVVFFGWWPLACVIFLLALLLLWSARRMMKAKFPLRFSAISILGPPVFVYLLVRSIAARRTHSLAWKGRIYATSNNEP